MMRGTRLLILLVALLVALSDKTVLAADKPNIVIILSDDVGYGDIGSYGATKVQTPHLDRLANEGLRFTNGYATSSVCTPTRYSLITGEYAWRSAAASKVISGVTPLTIDPAKPTLPSLLKEAGYATAGIGKWHLGLGAGPTNYNGDIRPGPLEIGFGSYFGIPATGDRVPTVFLQDHGVAGLLASDPVSVSYGQPVGNEPTGANPMGTMLKVQPSPGHDGTIVNGISRIGYMSGGKAARWVDEDFADTFASRAITFIEQNQSRPFFLYYATHNIHVPRMPNARFRGMSQCGIRCDAIVELDWQVGQVVDTLDRLGLSKNTLVLFSSDNGPVLNDGYTDGSVVDSTGHAPSGVLRGGKYDIFEGGTRVPFVTRWPGRIKPGVSTALVSLIDLLTSSSKLAERQVPANAGPDSFDVLAALLGDTQQSSRTSLVEHSGGAATGSNVGIVRGEWKLIPPAMAGGQPQLYNLAQDPGETKNVAAQNPDIVKELTDLLQKTITDGKSRPDYDWTFPDAGVGADGSVPMSDSSAPASEADGSMPSVSPEGSVGPGPVGAVDGGGSAGPSAGAAPAGGAGCSCRSGSAPGERVGVLLGLAGIALLAARRRR